jgi:hypothetical protein
MISFSEIQKKLVAPKGQFNKFGKYNYRSCEDILSGLKEVLGEWRLIINDEIVLIGERYYVKATVVCERDINTAVNTDGDRISLAKESYSASAYAREALTQPGMAEPQLTGSTSSYARKYALNALFCIDDTQDADTQDNTKKEPIKKPIAPQDNKARLELIEKIKELIGDRVESMGVQEKGAFLNSLGVKSSGDLVTKSLTDLQNIVIKMEVPW